MTTQLAFHNTQFNVVDRNGQPWLRSPQIAGALGYNRADRISDIYARHADEFTDHMTAVIKLPDLNPQTAGAGQMREIRIFSLRGAHLLAMLSRTKLAKEFRRWVLDILDREVGIGYERSPLTPAQQRTLQEAVSARTAGLTDQQKHLAFPRLWGGVKSTFRVPSYKELDQSQFEDALSYIHHYPLEGELLLKETAATPAVAPLADLAYPVDDWLKANPAIAKTQTLYGQGNLMIRFNDIHQSALHQLLTELAARGVNVDACWLEYRALINHVTVLQNACTIASRAIERTGNGLRIGKNEYH